MDEMMRKNTDQLPFSFFLYNSLFMALCIALCSSKFVRVVDTEAWGLLNFIYFYAVAFSLYFFIIFIVQFLLTEAC